jgi:hypothetical protein
MAKLEMTLEQLLSARARRDSLLFPKAFVTTETSPRWLRVSVGQAGGLEKFEKAVPS